jgi:hypothetical protein
MAEGGGRHFMRRARSDIDVFQTATRVTLHRLPRSSASFGRASVKHAHMSTGAVPHHLAPNVAASFGV